MGGRGSRNKQSPYEDKARVQPIWDHRSKLVSSDPIFSTAEEIKNFQKQNQLKYSKHNRIHESTRPSRNIYPSSPIPGYSAKRENKQVLGIRKSQSTGNLPNINTVSKSPSLFRDESKRKRRSPSPSSSELSLRSNPHKVKAQSSPKKNTDQISPQKFIAKQIPNNLHLVLINSNELQNMQEIGKGNFGTVYHALYKGTRDVALKTLHNRNQNSTASTSLIEYHRSMNKLLNEAYTMTLLKHPNLLRIIGITFVGPQEELGIVTDYMKKGSLLNYLKQNRRTFLKSNSQQITRKLNYFSTQIFDAMLYLEDRGIIHRDLAARNCLIGENDALKVGDFGLTKLTECGLYKGTYRTQCAPRWTAPEALFSAKYSSRSDVWSYGITLWEIYTLGERPFGDMHPFAVQVILKNPSENLGDLLTKPNQFGSDETYTHIILPCLTYNVTMRPRFRDLKDRVKRILSDTFHK